MHTEEGSREWPVSGNVEKRELSDKGKKRRSKDELHTILQARSIIGRMRWDGWELSWKMRLTASTH